MELRGVDRRRLYLASMMIGVYLLAVAFVAAMYAVISMYGGAPRGLEKEGYIIVIGALCLLLDLIHVKYNVQVRLGTSAEDDENIPTKILGATYGSLFVIFEGVIRTIVGESAESYIDPILMLVFASTITCTSADSVMKNASALLYQS